MYKYFSFLIFFLTVIIISSCKTDFNPNAEYKDITVVYGILNQSDTNTFIKINKAFLGNQNAYVMASDEFLSSYGTDLQVKLEELTGNDVSKVFNFDTCTVFTKDPGVFYAPKQVVYKCKTLNQLQESKTYKLTIKNIKTGKIISAQTHLVGSFKIDVPAAYQTTIDFTLTGKTKLQWYTANGGRKYQVDMRINYFESLNDTSHYVSKYVDVNLGFVNSTTLESGTPLQLEFPSVTYYQALKSNLIWSTQAHQIFRKPGMIEFFFNVAGDDLSTYIDLNGPSNSIVQVRPEFTNISNGIGIFSARYNNSVDKPRRVVLSSKSIDILKSETYSMLGF
ncbi:MAG: hypothetical protein NTZ33_00205 [Bacteroidetes bacterium]|nr:hypothetical protein [Bacteroidota bacterium]